MGVTFSVPWPDFSYHGLNSLNFGYTSLIFCLISVSFAIIGGGCVTIQAGMLTWPLVSS